MQSMSLHVADEAAMLDLASSLASSITPGTTIYLDGNLGAGKTVFARGVLHGLGYVGLVKSPTYSLVEPYRLSDDLSCYHFDLYRLADPEEIEFMGARDHFNEFSICLVEWPEKAKGFIPLADLVVSISVAESGRNLSIRANSPAGEEIMLRHNSN